MIECKRGAAKACGWLMAMLLAGLIAGCGSGSDNNSVVNPGNVAPGVPGTPGAALTNPTVLSANPANGALNVSVTSALTATFSQAMDPATITPVGTFTLKVTGGANVTGVVVMSAGNTVATFTPVALLPNTNYTVAMNTIARNVAGVAMPNPVVWTFTTSAAGTPGAAANPTVISSNPNNLATNVPTSTNGPGVVVTGTLVTATFNEAMDPTTITPVGVFTLKETVAGTNVPGTVTMNAANTIATFTPTAAALLVNTNYTATVSIAAKTALPANTPLTTAVSWTFTTAATLAAGQSAPNLGTAGTYGVFASAASITLAAGSVVKGDVGLNPADACIGCVVGISVIGGVINNGGALAVAAQNDFQATYVDASTRATNACTLTAPADLRTAQGACGANFVPGTPGPTYGPGLYRTAAPIGFTGTITLDAGGNPDAVFIFQTNSAITTATNSVIVLANSAQAKNVWWIAGAAATLGVTSIFKGNVIVNAAAITVLNGTQVEGGLFAGAAMTVNTGSTITVPPQ